jgi:signal transduction histidine kinase
MLAGLIVLAVMGLVAYSVRRVATPVRDLMEAAERVEAGDYGVRVAERGPRDVKDLARAFNAMTARLQTNDTQRRRLLADVTHELRTPLAVLQGNLEAMLDGVYARDDAHLTPVLDETRVLARLIDDLRTLSLAESGVLQLQREPTDLGILLTESLAAFTPQARAANVALKSNLAEELPLMDIDPVRVREVVSNLLANALRYTPAAGTITVRAQLGAASVQITVQDTGHGISPEILPHIFDRFYKSEESQGSGLGLAIAKSLVQAHGGEIWAASELNAGTQIGFKLPLMSSSASVVN